MEEDLNSFRRFPNFNRHPVIWKNVSYYSVITVIPMWVGMFHLVLSGKLSRTAEMFAFGIAVLVF